MNNQFIQKNGLAINIIARDILILSNGDKMKTISMYENQLSCSRWTIQTAIQFLLDNKALKIRSFGPKGSIVKQINKKLLFEYADWSPMLGLLPMPSSEIHHALFTGVVDAVNLVGLPINFAYMVPASKRFEMLAKRQCHFILTSKFAARSQRKKYPNLILALELDGCKYCSPYRLYTMRDDISSIEDGMRVGVHDAAIEQKHLTNKLCEGKCVEKKYANYQNCLIMLATGEIDVLIQRGDLKEAPIAASRSIKLPELDVEKEITTPVFMVNKDDYGSVTFLKNYIDPGIISNAQTSVLSGQRRMSYF